ncbi:hypothetical protein FsymDg_3034 [Candidatus Protofrankia datiscae]|uniref:Uncharacterized protein n=1 Tax=Candidatus Protofrankia datiscae TaxID=2716812 RepID=F8AXJ5_9ACTN|nr:hypothetical protein FsymDg_3034 [Candidatus Protofrankia datiscae]
MNDRRKSIVITRDGMAVGRFVPERHTVADRLKEALREYAADPAFADDLEAAHTDLRAAFTGEVRTWPDTCS